MKTMQIFLKCVLGGLFLFAFTFEMVSTVAPMINPQFSTGNFQFNAAVIFGATFGFIIFMLVDLYNRFGEENNLTTENS